VIALVVALGAAIGAPARYLTDRAVQNRHSTEVPWGTFVINVVASFVLGVITGAAAHLSATTVALLGTGFCGALSTFSTFSYETVALTRNGRSRVAMFYVAVSVAAGLAAAAAGWALGSAA
jgi:fluoride exporter